MKLRDKVAVVTGAGSGIGRALAVTLAQRGARLALADLNAAGLEATQQQLGLASDRVSLHVVDVARRAAVEAFAEEVIAQHGEAHVLINNAGVSVSAPFAELELEDFEWLMSINFWGVVYGCKAFLPHLRAAAERSGAAQIVNLSSLFGLIGVPLQSAYCSSKFAVRGFTETLRAELAGSGVGVTTVHPGGVATNIAAATRYPMADGEALRSRATAFFKKMMPPERAAAQIVRGVERDSARVVITAEAVAIDALKRAVPSLTQRLIEKNWRRFV